MFNHVVLWKFKAEANGKTKEQNLVICLEKMTKLPGLIPQIRSFKVGADILHTPASCDLALVVAFENQEDFLVYRDHPEHVPVAQFIGSVAESRVAADFLTD